MEVNGNSLDGIEKVYHYCSIDTLQKILSNKTIRFGRFDLMDDQTETHGLPEMLKKKYFLSCWVADSKEKIPQWAMYAPQGVRIELPLRWYKHHKIPVDGTDQYIDKLPETGFGKPFFPFPFEHYQQRSKFFFTTPFDEEEGFIVKVRYNENFIELKKQLWRETENGDGIGLRHPAAPILYKDSYWSFQDEIRYYLQAICTHEDRNLLPEYFDIPISKDALRSIKIRLHPNCSVTDLNSVREIISDHLITSDSYDILQISHLDGKYKPKNS